MNHFRFLIFFILSSSLLANNNPLDKLALKYGTDKSSQSHNYTKLYDTYFSSMRNEPIRFLEIGILNGSSALMWENYFGNASLYFIDIDEKSIYSAQKALSTRSHCYKVDQSNVNSLLSFTQQSGGNFDIILDDGGHTMQQQITSFKTLFPFLKENGVYIIEDLHTSFWKNWGGSGTQTNPKADNATTIGYLKELLTDINIIGGYTGCADTEKCPTNLKNNLTYLQQHILSMHFYNSVCFIFKH